MAEIWKEMIGWFFNNAGVITVVIIAVMFGFITGAGVVDYVIKRRERNKQIWYVGGGGLYRKQHYDDRQERLRWDDRD